MGNEEQVEKLPNDNQHRHLLPDWLNQLSPQLMVSVALLVLVIAIVGIFAVGFINSLPEPYKNYILLFFVVLAAAGCEFIDSSLGMGYGTTLTPLLLLAGFAPLDVVPAVLLSELCTGVMAGTLHNYEGNLELVHDQKARQTTLVLAGLSLVGATLAALLAIRISATVLGTLIGIIVVIMGGVILVCRDRTFQYRRSQVVLLGTLAAFNKGLSGGGYGPLVTGGQVLCGVSPKKAVGITSLAEAGTCLVAVIVYLACGRPLVSQLLWPLLLGGLISVPFSVVTIKRLPTHKVGLAIGLGTLTLGLLSLGKIWI